MPKLEEDYRIIAVQEHAEDNYETDGWDFVLETMEIEDIYWIVYQARSSEGAIKRMAEYLAPLAGYRDDIVSA